MFGGIRRAGVGLLAIMLLVGLLSGPAAAKQDPPSQALLAGFLQKHFRIPNPSQISLSPPGKSPFPGVAMRTVTVTADNGRKLNFNLFTSSHRSDAIVGQLLNVGEHEGSGGGRDQALGDFLRAHFHMPPTSQVNLAPPTHSPFPKLLNREVTVTEDGHEIAHFNLFVDPSLQHAVAGQMIDLLGDPWNRVDLSTIHLTDRPTLGPSDAPVTIVEFGDFECPYCAHAINTVENAVRNTYRGKVRLIFKNFPLRGHAWADAAAIAGECVREQNPATFWDYVHDIYQNQKSITADNLRQRVELFATAHGLDRSVLNACMTGNTAENRVQQDIADGMRLHVHSTPSFFINGIPLLGDPDPKTLDYVINAAMGRRGAVSAASAHRPG